jgi:hypothetical protein
MTASGRVRWFERHHMDNRFRRKGVTRDPAANGHLLLGRENVADAIQAVRPAGVDSKTKTDQHGSHRKDIDRVRLFSQAARSALIKCAAGRAQYLNRHSSFVTGLYRAGCRIYRTDIIPLTMTSSMSAAINATAADTNRIGYGSSILEKMYEKP